ncbi:MAG TPA: hypothetical protein VII56_17795 [Rhizomicrobium sp.]
MTKFPRHHNALQVAEILGPDCFEATEAHAIAGVIDFYSKKGGFSYDPTRRRTVGLVSRHIPLERALAEVESSGQPLGRPWNAELLRTIHQQYAGRTYRCRPIKLAARPIAEGLLLRIPCNYFIVEGDKVSFNILQLSRSELSRLSPSQVRFVLSATWHTLATGDMAKASASLCDLSKVAKKGERQPVWHSSEAVGLVSRDQLNAVLTNYMRGYAQAVDGRLLPDRAYKPARGWEEDQYKLL